MSKVRIRLSGNWPAWNASVRAGRMTSSNGATRQVLIHIRRDLPNDAGARARARQDGRVLAELDDPGLLRIFHVSTLEEHSAEVCEFFRAASLSTIRDCMEAIGEQLPLRIAVELAAETAGVLAAVLGGTPDDDALVIHPGVGPEQVLMDDGGNVKLVGFGVLRPEDHQQNGRDGYTPPEGFVPDGCAYGVGALLVSLLTDAPLPPSLTEQSAHDGVVDSLMVSVLARGGEPIPDSLVRQIRSCLAFLPKDRPRLGGLANELRDLARSLPGPSVRTWAAARIPGVLQGTGLAPTPPVVQAVGNALGGDGEETMSMGHTVRVESAQVTEEVPRIQPLPVGTRSQDDSLHEDEATVRLTKEEIQRHLDMTQRMPAEKPGLTHRPTGEGTESVVALGLSLGEEERANRLERRELVDGQGPFARTELPSRGPLVYIASMALIGLLGWMVLNLLGDEPASEPVEKSAESVETVGAPSTELVSPMVHPASSEDAKQLSGEEKGAAVQLDPSLEDPLPSSESITPSTNVPPTQSKEVRSPEPIAGPAQEDEEEKPLSELPSEPPGESSENEPILVNGEGDGQEDAEVAPTTTEDPTDDNIQVVEDEADDPVEELEPNETLSDDDDEDLMYIAPVEEADSSPVDADPVDPTNFSVIFHSRDPGLVTLEVKCSSGFGTGPSPLTVNVRATGPCVVRARDSNGILAPRTAHVPITGPKNFYCFESGGNACRAGS